MGFSIYYSVFSPFEYTRRKTKEVINIGGHNVPRVVADFSNETTISPSSFLSLGYNYSEKLDKWNLRDQACDYIFLGNSKIDFEIPGTLGLIYNYETWKALSDKTRCYPLFTTKDFFEMEHINSELSFVSLTIDDLLTSNFKLQTSNYKNVVFVFETDNEHGMAEQRRMFFYLIENNFDSPVIIKRNYDGSDETTFQLHASTDCGTLFLDGFGDGIWLKAKAINHKIINSTSFGILQATRTRVSKTEYISCPSCGRTLFDLQETTTKIRSRTDHLKGIKIGIMGCIVNGPGEMADADYGYVGVGVGKITLYKGKEVVQRAIDSDKAVDALIDLIRQNGDWVERI